MKSDNHMHYLRGYLFGFKVPSSAYGKQPPYSYDNHTRPLYEHHKTVMTMKEINKKLGFIQSLDTVEK